jgi:hypothetical protein
LATTDHTIFDLVALTGVVGIAVMYQVARRRVAVRRKRITGRVAMQVARDAWPAASADVRAVAEPSWTGTMPEVEDATEARTTEGGTTAAGVLPSSRNKKLMQPSLPRRRSFALPPTTPRAPLLPIGATPVLYPISPNQLVAKRDA